MKLSFVSHVHELEKLEKEYVGKNIPHIQHLDEITEAISRSSCYVSFGGFNFKTLEDYKRDIDFFNKMGRYSVVPKLCEIADEIKDDIEAIEDFMVGYGFIK